MMPTNSLQVQLLKDSWEPAQRPCKTLKEELENLGAGFGLESFEVLHPSGRLKKCRGSAKLCRVPKHLDAGARSGKGRLTPWR